MPLKLRSVLGNACIAHTQIGKAIRQSDGKPLSESTVSLWLGKSIWPKRTPRAWLETQVRQFLREHQVAEADAPDLFETDEERTAERASTVSEIFVAHPGQRKQRRLAGALQHLQAQANSDESEHLEPVMLSQKARKHFSLFASPFVDDVQGPEDVFLSADQRYVREAIRQACRRGGHMIGVVGESGSGKTTLRRETLDWLVREGLPCVVIQPRIIDKTEMTARHISEAILKDLHPDMKPARTLEGLGRQIENALQNSGRAGQTHVLIIEEAHDMTIQTLKYLKRFWEIEDGFRKLLSVVLIGQPELKDKLDARRYYEAREVINRCEVVELLPLDNVLADYLSLKFKRCEKALADVMTPEAVEAVRMRLTVNGRNGPESRVYPLLVNNLVTRAMNEAADLGAPQITADIVRSC